MGARAIRKYLIAIDVYEGETDVRPFFTTLKQEILGEKDPILAGFWDYYGKHKCKSADDCEISHEVVIIGYYDVGPLGQYAMVVDTNVAVTAYAMPWSYFSKHFLEIMYVDGVSIAG